MKTSSLTAIFISLFCMLVSCSKDDPPPAEKLVGKWSSGTVSIDLTLSFTRD